MVCVSPILNAENQALYVWFLMIFPTALIVLFFSTLNFNHSVLYAPSDYKDEDNFLRALPRATYIEKVQKIEAELDQSARINFVPPDSTPGSVASEQAKEIHAKPHPMQRVDYEALVRRSEQATYMLAEELVFARLSKEFSSEIQREVRLGSPGKRYLVDGIVRDKGLTTVIEVKYLQRGLLTMTQLQDTFERVREASKVLPPDQAARLRALLIVVTTEENKYQVAAEAKVDGLRSSYPFSIELRLYTLQDLQTRA